MRTAHLPMVLGLVIPTATLSAQTSPDGWALRVAVSRDAFTGASSDTTALPGANVDIQPAPRLAVEIGVRRAFQGWEFILATGYAAGGMRAATDQLTIEDRTGSVDRWRASLLMGKRLVSLDRATLSLLAGPGIDHWESDGLGNRTTLSGRVGLALRVPLGGITFENSAFFGLGGTPFDRRYVPPETTLRSIRTWSIGAGLLIGL